MTRAEAIGILDGVIPPPEHHAVDLDHLRIAQAWLCIKETLTAEPIKHGRWELKYFKRWGGYFPTCTVCGNPFYATKYCPNCGAKMDGEENGI